MTHKKLSLSQLGITESEILIACKVLSAIPVGSTTRIPHIDLSRKSITEYNISISDHTSGVEIYDNPLFE